MKKRNEGVRWCTPPGRYGTTIVVIAVTVLIAVILSCVSSSQLRLETVGGFAAKGAYLKAIRKIRTSEALYGNLNRFLYYFDQGVLFHYMGEYDSSLFFLQQAEKTLDDLYARSITNEAASILTNDNLRPYRSRRYEQIMLHQFMALCYLAKGEAEEALVEARKVQLVIDAFRERDGEREKYNDDGMAHYLAAIAYAAQDMPDDATISLYKSVSAYRAGPVPLPRCVSSTAYRTLLSGGRLDDIERLGLESDAGPSGEGGAWELGSEQSEIVFIGYAGKGPVLSELVMWGNYVADGLLVLHYRDPRSQEIATLTLPAPPLPDVEAEKRGERGAREKVKSGTTFFVKVAIPRAVRRNSQTAFFGVSVDEQSEATTETLTDVNVLLEKDLEDNRARTIARTVVRVVLRTMAAQKFKQKLQTASPEANLLLSLGTDLLSAQMERADTRLSFLLPQTVQIARVPVTPGMHRVRVTARSTSGAVLAQRVWEQVAVREREKKILIFPSLQ